jgi:hypothetical protein
MAAVNPSVRIDKVMPFKGGSRLWSNRYHFSGGTPADATHWHTLMDAITAAEKATFTNRVTITAATGYAAGSEVPVASKVYSIAGTLTPVTGSASAPGEVVALVRYATAGRSTKNHPIYCFNYVHGACVDPLFTNCDVLDANQKAALATFGADWISGFSDGSITAVRASPSGHNATGVVVEEYVTHRDFPYTSSV